MSESCAVCGDRYAVRSNDEATARTACRCEVTHKCTYQKRGGKCGAVAQVITSPYDSHEVIEWRCFEHAIEELMAENLMFREGALDHAQLDERMAGMIMEEIFFVGQHKEVKSRMKLYTRKVACMTCQDKHAFSKRRLDGAGCGWWAVCPKCGADALVYQE